VETFCVQRTFLHQAIDAAQTKDRRSLSRYPTVAFCNVPRHGACVLLVRAAAARQCLLTVTMDRPRAGAATANRYCVTHTQAVPWPSGLPMSCGFTTHAHVVCNLI